MFTGIIEHFGIITRIETLVYGKRFFLSHELSNQVIGDSLAVNGVCFTITSLDKNELSIEASPETLLVTTTNQLTLGQKVHLEQPVSMSKPLGGHFVTGHVDEVLQVLEVEPLKDFYRIVFGGISKPEWVCHKGSIALNGVSLTINKILSNSSIECMLIPHTLDNTCFNELKQQDKVNVEYDYLAKIVARQHALIHNAATQFTSEEM